MSNKQYGQQDINRMFNYMMNGEEIEFVDDCERIIKAVSNYRGISISVAEAVKFWRTRSGWWDACWLALPKKDEEIIEYWNKFVEDWHKDEIDD